MTMSPSGDPIVAGGGFSDTTGDTNTDAQDEQAAMQQWTSNSALQQFVAENYGYDLWMLSNPELAPILISAAFNGWDQARIDGALFQTNWWKTNSQAIRQFQDLQSTDPATASQQVAQMRSTIIATANELGVQLSVPSIQNLATMATELNWDSDTIKLAVAQQYQGTTTNPTGGVAGDFQDQAKQLAGQYAIPLSDSALAQWTNNAVMGSADISGFEDSLREQAKVMYPWMSKSLDQGMTPESYLSPYTSQAQSLLGISPDQVNWTDPKWLSAVLQTQPDGTSAPVSLTQFANTLRNNPAFGYQYTADAKSNAYTMARQITETFGKVAG